MRAPEFWYSPKGLAAVILWPMAKLYAAGTARRLRLGKRLRPGIPVICVGNLTVGGTGKTPTVIALIDMLQKRGLRPAVLSRGYGGRIVGPHRVDTRTDSALDVGDEPLLLSAFAPVWVSRDRAEGARMAAASGADIIVMDDGFQNGDLFHDLSLVVVDAKRGFGNGRVIPAGPLREPVAQGLARADLVITVGDADAKGNSKGVLKGVSDVPMLAASLMPLQTGMDWRDLRVVAFAGIGDPERFFKTLRDLGADVVETHALDDHQHLSPRLMHRLVTSAKQEGARLVTTEKDAVRLPQDLRTEVLTLPVRLNFDDTSMLDAQIERVLGSKD